MCLDAHLSWFNCISIHCQLKWLKKFTKHLSKTLFKKKKWADFELWPNQDQSFLAVDWMGTQDLFMSLKCGCPCPQIQWELISSECSQIEYVFIHSLSWQIFTEQLTCHQMDIPDLRTEWRHQSQKHKNACEIEATIRTFKSRTL